MSRYAAVDALIDELRRGPLADHPELAATFSQCYPNVLRTTTELLDDGTTFVFTGDIPAMWLRDSSAQVSPYLPLASQDPDLRRLIRGLIRRQATYLLHDCYANAFNKDATGHGHGGDQPSPSPLVWERKFELDSLCYPITLCHAYWQATGDTAACDDAVYHMLHRVVHIMRVEQDHDHHSPYTFQRPDPLLPSDTLPFQGRGTRTNVTGMVWSGFRPSDDACTFGYLVPANMFAVVALGRAADLARTIYHDEDLAASASALREEIEFGIQTYGLVEHPRHGRIYAYETDGYGNHLLMDDANVPSLLSMPYLGYRPPDDPLYQNTRRFVLSSDNPYYAQGRYARGIGSPHTPRGHVWPIALMVQAPTSLDRAEQDELLRMLVTTTAGTGYMHESFHPDDPACFTRPWFAWANSLFGELVHRWSMGSPEPIPVVLAG